MNNIKHVTGTYIGVDYQFEGFNRELMNNRFILLKKCLDKLESIPIEPASVWDYEYKQDVKKYLNEIAAIKFIYADTGKPRLNMQKFYGKTAKQIKEAFNELCDCVNTNYKNYFVIMMELNIDITAFLKELDLEIVKYLFLAMKNKYRITAWFKKTLLYILSEINKYKYPQELLDKLKRESRESFRDINFYEGFPLPLSAQYPDYFDQKLDTLYIAPESYNNIMPSSKLLNKKFENASVRWNYGYGYASSCQANNDRGLDLEKIHNLNMQEQISQLERSFNKSQFNLTNDWFEDDRQQREQAQR